MSAAPSAGSDGLLVDRRGGATRLVLNRPDRLNAVTFSVMNALPDELERASADPACRVIVLTGSGRGFCSGADLVGYNDVDERTTAQADSLELATRVATAIVHAPKPVIALVNGPAAGIGAALALSCDLVLAAESAFFKLGFDQLGIIPDGGATAFLTVSAGRHLAMRYALLGDRIPAHEAERLGLVARVWPDQEFHDESAAIVQRFASGPVLGIAATKRAINAVALPGLDDALHNEAVTQVALLETADYAEGVAAFQEKRTPSFLGR